MKKIADGNYVDSIREGITLVDFYASWCMPCLRMEKQVEDFASKNPNVNVYKYDVDSGVMIWNQVKSEFKVRSIPFVVLYRDGEVVSSAIGYKSSEELQKILDNIQ